MAFKREERVADEVKRIVADLIRTELDDPRVPVFTSLTEVTVSKDFNYADLYVSVLADRDGKEEAVKALNNAKGFLRSALAKRIDLRVSPELRFHLDDSFDKGKRIDELLAQVRESDAKRSKIDEIEMSSEE